MAQETIRIALAVNELALLTNTVQTILTSSADNLDYEEITVHQKLYKKLRRALNNADTGVASVAYKTTPRADPFAELRAESRAAEQQQRLRDAMTPEQKEAHRLSQLADYTEQEAELKEQFFMQQITLQDLMDKMISLTPEEYEVAVSRGLIAANT